MRRVAVGDHADHRLQLGAGDLEGYLSSVGTVIETVINTTARVSVRRPGGLLYSLPSHFAVYDAIRSRHPELAKAQMWTLIEDAQQDVKLIIG